MGIARRNAVGDKLKRFCDYVELLTRALFFDVLYVGIVVERGVPIPSSR
jgi:hypothetical protein